MRQLIKTTTYFLCVKVDTFLFLTFYWGKRVGLPMSYHQHCISYTITTSVYPPPPFATVVKHSPFMAFFQKKVKLLVGLLLSVWHIVFPTKAKKRQLKLNHFVDVWESVTDRQKKLTPKQIGFQLFVCFVKTTLKLAFWRSFWSVMKITKKKPANAKHHLSSLLSCRFFNTLVKKNFSIQNSRFAFLI